jgi:hypothetical protein
MDSPTADLPVPEFVFTFAAAGDAIAGEKKLLAGGISPAVMPLPDQLGAGCGICLRVRPEQLEQARTLLGIGFKGIYAVYAAAEPPDKKIFRPWNP